MSITVPNGEFVDYYALLEIESDAGLNHIRSNYIRLAKAHHPDTGGATDNMQLLNNAYKTLSGSMSRIAYDKLYELHFGKSAGPQFDEHGELSHNGSLMSEDYVDYFLDKLYAEYHAVPKPKPKSLKRKITRILQKRAKKAGI